MKGDFKRFIGSGAGAQMLQEAGKALVVKKNEESAVKDLQSISAPSPLAKNEFDNFLAAEGDPSA